MYLDDAYQPLIVSAEQRRRFNTIESIWQVEKLSPTEFVLYCGTLFESDGHTVYMPTSMADHAIDLLLVRGTEVLIVQCLQTNGTIDLSTIQQLNTTALRNDGTRGIYVTTGQISTDAIYWASHQPIDLLDGDALMGWVQYTKVADSGLDETIIDPAERIDVLQENTIPYTPIASAEPVQPRKDRRGLIRWGLTLGSLLAVCMVTFWVGMKLFAGGESDDTPLLVPPTRSGIQQSDDEGNEIAPTATVRSTIVLKTGDIEIPLVTPKKFDTYVGNYQALKPIQIEYLVETMDDVWDGTEDLSAEWRVGYDTNYLYGFVTVEDDIYIQRYAPDLAYIDDSLEIEIDTDHDRAGTGQPDDYQYIISPGDFKNLPAGIFRYQGNGEAMKASYGSRADVKSQKTGTGYTVSFRIPWYDIGMAKPEVGTTVGMTLIVNDKDMPVEGEQELIYSNVKERKWNTPSTWGTVLLGE